MKKRGQIAKYIFFDLLGSSLAWFLFNLYLQQIAEFQPYRVSLSFLSTSHFWGQLAIYCLTWIAIFLLAGLYSKPYGRSRLGELGQSITATILGSFIIFLVIFINSRIYSKLQYFNLLCIIMLLQFILSYIPRLVITTIITKKIHKGELGLPTIIIGNGCRARDYVEELKTQKVAQGYKIIGHVAVSEQSPEIAINTPLLGKLTDLHSIIKQHNVHEAILAADSTDSQRLTDIINELIPLDVNLHAIPSMYDILSGRVKMTGILNSPLIHISLELMPYWQKILKFGFSYIIAFVALIVLFPLSVVVAIIIKLTSKGSIIYKQERIGQYGKPFMIYKFRSMYADAEHSGPSLSSKHDSRVTPIGRFMRKTRIDEIPNFVNVIKGDMTLVGPRPERQFYIDQIVKVAPHYLHLQKLKPGITSWGQVKFGYAENVEQMVDRLRYDILYLENMSILVDLKIIIYTIITIFKGRGI